LVGVDIKLIHPCDERSPLESEEGGGAISSANTATRLLEGLDDLIAINFGENASDRPAFRRPGACVFADRYCARMQFREGYL
jgi:hypothetical protein